MFSGNDDSKQFLADLEDYLDQGPQASPQRLSEIASWLKHLESAESSESDVKTVQLLGTAAGKQLDEQRTAYSSEHGDLYKTDSNRRMAGSIQGA